MYKEQKSANESINVTHNIEIIIRQHPIYKQKTTETSPFGAHFGGKPNTPLIIITKPKLSNLSYEKF